MLALSTAHKFFLSGVRTSFLQGCACLRTHTHTHTITDVTRIQEGVVAYYVLTAHTGCLAWLGLFKRLRLDKQRGLRSRLISAISGCCSVLN